MNRLGLLGGTFDPPHYGHLVAAQEAWWQLNLTRVVFLPARQNPLKRDEPATAVARCEMVRCAIEDDPRFELSRLDLDRPGPSYSVDVVRELSAPDRQLYFLIGADILPELPRWHAPLEILHLATLIVVNRPGASRPDLEQLERRLPGAAARVELLTIPGVAVSSSDLRARVKRGQPIRYLTPPKVEAYIQEHGLYV